MKKKYLIGAVIVAVLATGSAFTISGLNDSTAVKESSKKASVSEKSITMHKSPNCGCCGRYGEYLEEKGYAVTVNETEDMDAVKEKLAIPSELKSCHTLEIGGYVIEGHVPKAAIAKLLAERPDIKGIGMAGMPTGSPGMPGLKKELKIYAIDNDGTKGSLYETL